MKKSKWYNNGLVEICIKPIDTIPEGFTKGRLPKPKKIDSLKNLISKEDLYDKYIIKNISFKDLFELLSISPRELRILLTAYNIRKDTKKRSDNNYYRRSHEQAILIGKKSSETQRNAWKNKSEEEKQAWSKRCRDIELNLDAETKYKKSKARNDWWFGLSDNDRAKINKQRSDTLNQTWNNNKDNIISKQKTTAKENRKNRLCRSISEQNMFDKLISLYVDTLYDVRVDDRYPFYCDFYIPSLDLFIELNAHPSHGRLPIRYLNVDEYSKYPSKWVDVFAKRDVLKYEKSQQSNINYITIYPQATLDENLMINKTNQDLVKILYQTQKI